MHPRQANLLNDLSELIEKTAAKKPVGGGTPMLWKYTDPDSSQEFFLPLRLRTVRSPYSGKIFPAKPEKHTVPDVGKELRQEAKEPSAAPGPKMSAPKNKGKGKKRADWNVQPIAEATPVASEIPVASHPIQEALIAQADEIISKLAAMPLLWKYVDPDGKEFFITERLHTIHSPFTGRAFPAKPERHTPSDVGKELRDEMRAPAADDADPMGGAPFAVG